MGQVVIVNENLASIDLPGKIKGLIEWLLYNEQSLNKIFRLPSYHPYACVSLPSSC